MEYLCRRGVLHLLLCAAVADDAAAVEEFLKQGVDPGVRDPLGRTALHITAELCRPNAAKTLLAHGADLNAGDKEGNTPLHRAAANCHYAPAQLLIQHGADPNAKNNQDKTPADLANCPGKARVLRGYSPQALGRSGFAAGGVSGLSA